jgi:hypothetical protein
MSRLLLSHHQGDVYNGIYIHVSIYVSIQLHADSSGRAAKGVGLRPLAYWDCGFESRWGHGCLSLVSVVCCQVEGSASG